MMKKIEKKKEVQKILLSLLLSKRGPTLLNNLDHEYFQSEEEYIPWKKLGHVNLVAFLKSMPESFLLEKSNSSYLVYGIPSDKSKHVSSLVSRQKIPKRVTSIRSRPRTIHNFLHTQNHSIRIPAEKLNWLMQYIKEHPLGISIFHVIQELRKMLPYMKLTAEDLQQQLCEMNHQLYMDGNIIYAQKDTLASSENTSGFSHSLINWAEVKDNDSELLKKKCTSEDLDDFWDPTTYENPKVIYDVPSKYDNDEYESVSKSYDIGNDAFSADQDLSGLINDKVQLRLKNLMEKYPNGITCADLPELYLKEYKVSLNYEKLGFSSVRAYVSYLPHIFYMKQPNIKDDFILYSADKRPIDQEKTALSEIKTDDLSNYHCSSVKSEENSDNVDYNEDDENVPFPNDLPPNVCEIFRPENAMFDEDIGYISVTDLQNSKKAYLEVYIVDVFTPSFFWIQLRKGKNRLQKLMNDLNVHYDKHKKMYHIPRLGLKRGLHCVCLFSNVWHRAIIKTVKPDYKVTVMFYDYGTLKMYLPEEVYYLDKSFTRLPAQAIACSLYNVQPCVGDRWKKSITHRFIDKIADTILAATIVSVDASNNSMSVILTDTSEEEDVHINNWLVQENLARKGKMVCNFTFPSYLEFISNVNAPDSANIKDMIAVDNNVLDNETHVNSNSHKCPSKAPSDTKLQQEDFSANEKANGPRELIALLNKLKTYKMRNVSSHADRNDAQQIDVKNDVKPRDSDNLSDCGYLKKKQKIKVDSADLYDLNNGESRFGTFHSLYGGRGEYKPFNWSVTLQDEPAHVATSLDNHPKIALSAINRDNKESRNQVDESSAKQFFLNFASKENEFFSVDNSIDYNSEDVSQSVAKLKARLEVRNDKYTTVYVPRNILEELRSNELNNAQFSDANNIETDDTSSSLKRTTNEIDMNENDKTCEMRNDREIPNENSNSEFLRLPSSNLNNNNEDNKNMIESDTSAKESNSDLNLKKELSPADNLFNSKYTMLLKRIKQIKLSSNSTFESGDSSESFQSSYSSSKITLSNEEQEKTFNQKNAAIKFESSKNSSMRSKVMQQALKMQQNTNQLDSDDDSNQESNNNDQSIKSVNHNINTISDIDANDKLIEMTTVLPVFSDSDEVSDESEWDVCASPNFFQSILNQN